VDNRVQAVSPDGNMMIRQVCAAAELLTRRLFVENRPDSDATVLSLGQGFGDVRAAEAVCLHIDARNGLGDLLHDRQRAAAFWTEIDSYAIFGGRGHRRLAPLFGREWNAGRQKNSTAGNRQQVSHATHDAFETVGIKREGKWDRVGC